MISRWAEGDELRDHDPASFGRCCIKVFDKYILSNANTF